MTARQNKSIFGRQMGPVDYKDSLNATDKFNSKLKKKYSYLIDTGISTSKWDFNGNRLKTNQKALTWANHLIVIINVKIFFSQNKVSFCRFLFLFLNKHV